jgi:hypothetical protein
MIDGKVKGDQIWSFIMGEKKMQLFLAWCCDSVAIVPHLTLSRVLGRVSIVPGSTRDGIITKCRDS